MHRVSHFNILKGALNGQELLNFFEEALEEVDRHDNFVLKDGDVVVMNNCGFHHAHDIEPILRHMLLRRGIQLLFQPPYHLFTILRVLFSLHKKCWLRRFPLYTEHYTEHYPEVAIAEATGCIGPSVSREFFRHCGYI